MRFGNVLLTVAIGLPFNVGCERDKGADEPVITSTSGAQHRTEAELGASRKVDAVSSKKSSEVRPKMVAKATSDDRGVRFSKPVGQGSAKAGARGAGDETGDVDAAAADNSARNKVDRDERTLTPMDQSNSKTDIAITAAIRRGLMKSDGLSLNAKNVKIITRAGVVTLRGVVSTRDERELIRDMAAGTEGVRKVDNELTVTAH